MRKNLVRLSVVGLSALILGASGATTASGTSDNPCYRLTALERKLGAKINESRRRNGLDPLQVDPELSRVSRYHGKEMRDTQTVHHTPEGKITRRITNWDIIGEAPGVARYVSVIHRRFMREDEHRVIMLHRKLRHIGIGIKVEGDKLWTTTTFTGRGNPGTRMSMPDC